MSKWTYLKYFEVFEMAAIFRSEQFIELEIVLEIEYNTMAMLSPTFWAFVRRSSSTIDGVMAISKFDLFFFPRDLVIWPLTNNICRLMWRTRLHIWAKFSDDWLQIATCIAENVTISFKDEI